MIKPGVLFEEMMKTLGVIPARYGSTRFPGKPLALIAGRPMIQHVYQRCLKARTLDRVVVATDDRRIYDCIRSFNGQAVMSSARHKSGSDRIAEIIEKTGYRGFDIIINIQGDEPLIDHKAIDLLAKSMKAEKNVQMATLASDFNSRQEIDDPNTAKIVTDIKGNALYFSRSPIPFIRETKKAEVRSYLKHIGMYAYRRDFLLQFTKWEEGRLESMEKLEQLRALENGVNIKVLYTKYNSLSVDTPDDIMAVEKYLKAGGYGKSQIK